MKSRHYLPLVLIVAFSCQTKKQNDQPANGVEWVSLFNGKDLEGWTMKIVGYEAGENFGNTFRVEDGLLKIRYDEYDSFRNRFGALYYEKQFSEYRLRAEYRFVGETTPGAPEWGYRDSGIQYHCQAPSTIAKDQWFPVCLEYNLHGGNGTDERPVGEICANGTYVRVGGKKNESYCTPPTVKKTFHGDQWVTLEIDIKDGQVKHFANGEEILAYEDPRYNPEHEIGKTMIQGEEDRVREGYISLQSNSHPIEFRKIEIMEYR